MKDRVKLIIEKPNGSHTSSPVLRSVVRREGTRSVDTASMVVSSKTNVEENDIVKYIQDEVSTEFLTGMYNFQGSCRDESGNNLDGTGNADYMTPTNGNNTKKFKANYALSFDSAGEEISVSDNTLLDFRKQFDIMIAFTIHSNNVNTHFNGSSNTVQILFSKHDGTHGVEIGLKLVGSTWRIYAKLDSTEFDGDETIKNISVQSGYISQTYSRSIRFYRDDKNKVRLTLEGLIDGNNCSQTVVPVSSRATSTMYFGTDRTQTKDFHGLIHQIRIYTGGFLKEGESNRLLTVAAQPMTMKFVGKVWKITDALDRKKIECKGLTKFILDSSLSADILTGTVSSPTTNEPATRDTNIFRTGQYITDILQTILYKIDPSFIWLRTFSDGNRSTVTGRYAASGGYLNTLDLLSVKDNKTFFTLPTKVLVYEKEDGYDTGFTFHHNNSIITKRGKDEIKIVNDVELIGRLQTQYIEQGLGNVSSGSSSSLNYVPKSLSLIDTSGAIITSGYTVDLDGQTINWTSSYTGVTAKYHYEKITGSSSDVLYYRNDDSGSISTYGRMSKKMYIPQFTNRTDFSTYGQKLIALLKDIKPRYELTVPYLVNGLRENHKITLSNSVMKFDGSTTTNQIIKSIEWRYPECTTKIECGEHKFDGYEIGKASNETLSQLSGSITTTKNT